MATEHTRRPLCLYDTCHLVLLHNVVFGQLLSLVADAALVGILQARFG